jgi:hypothetical protein
MDAVLGDDDIDLDDELEGAVAILEFGDIQRQVLEECEDDFRPR